MDFNQMYDVLDFLSVETLKAIDYGLLDLSEVKNYKLKEVLIFFENLLTYELKLNYLNNNTGVFRVSFDEKFRYQEFDYIIEADSLEELEEMVLAENRIWYVFDEFLKENTLKNLR